MAFTAEEKTARAAERHAQTVARHDALIAEARAVGNRLPPQFQAWGSMRTRAWERASTRLRGLASRATLRPGEVRAAIDQVKAIDGLSIEECVALLRNGRCSEDA